MKPIAFPVVACLISQSWSAALAQEGSLTLPISPEDAVELSLQDVPLDRELSDILRVFVGPTDACCASKTPMTGAYSIEGRALTFEPAFEFIAGQIYTVQSREEAVSLTSFVIAPDADVPIPEVVAIYPSGQTIPENTLRFYIQFSTPMMPHRAGGFIKLVDENGDADMAAFMSFTQELWSEDRTRLTLLMDPGRIKRGVAQNMTLGPALRQGNQYSLVIEEGWPSAIGQRDVSRYERSFTVSPALRSLPDVGLWHVQPPKLATDTPLVIAFDRPFDHQQAQNAIAVRDATGRRIGGTVILEDHQQTWRFEPDAPWPSSRVQIVVDTHFEDVAGNNFRDLLDHSLGADRLTQDQETITIDVILDP